MDRITVPGCDAGGSASIVPNGDGTYTCRCLVCGRCGKHTGNGTQGHYWGFCKVTHSLRKHHFCCPGDCELESPTSEPEIAHTCADDGSGIAECVPCTMADERDYAWRADR